MKRRNSGQVLVLVALAIFVLLGFAALGIDVGYMYSVRHELQRSADAGALAGASAFTTGDWNNTNMDNTSPRGIADFRARDFASKDKVVQTTLNPASEVAVSFPRLDHIEVVTSRTADLFFARIFGMSNRLITARAVARASNTDKKACVKPWAIPLPWVDDNTTNGLFDAAEGGSVKPLCESEGDTDCWAKGTAMTLKVGSPSMDNSLATGQQTSGQFFIIQGNVSDPYNGANTYSEYIAGSNCLEVSLGEPIDLMPGNKMGPTVKPVEDLIATGDDWDGIGPLPTNTGNRLVYVVVYDPRVSITGGGGQTGGSGTQAYIPGNISGNLATVWFAGFYLDAINKQGNDGWVTGKYTGIMLNGTGTNEGAPIGNVAKHVELVE